jgi:hypothetical protein
MASQIKFKESFGVGSFEGARLGRRDSSRNIKSYLTPGEQAEAAVAHKVRIGNKGVIAILTRPASA